MKTHFREVLVLDFRIKVADMGMHFWRIFIIIL